jgi:hypothetical protein
MVLLVFFLELRDSRVSPSSLWWGTPWHGVSRVSSLVRDTLVPLEFVPKKGTDQLLGLAGEVAEHPDSQILGKGEQAAVEAAAEERRDSGGGETLEALQPSLVGKAQPVDATSLLSLQLDEHELVCRAESGSHVFSSNRNGQHCRLLLLRSSASLVPDRKSSLIMVACGYLTGMDLAI